MKLNIVMEYAGGGDLAARIQQAKTKDEHFEEQQILNWFTQMCLGIKHIHDRYSKSNAEKLSIGISKDKIYSSPMTTVLRSAILGLPKC